MKRRVYGTVKRAANQHPEAAADQVRKAYMNMNLGIPDQEGVLDIYVSIDRSWQKWGITYNGIVTVTDIITGQVLDYITLSNFCRV